MKLETKSDGRSKDDSRELARFGYVQQLRRSMGAFSSFAISFSLISIITGIFANFGFGYRQVGPAILWSWTVVGFGQFLVALVMADLATRIPISGYGYQWTSRLLNPHFGYFVGWLLLMQFLTGFPGVCQALAATLSGMAGGGNGEWIVTGLTVGVISLITLVHLYGIRLVSRVNNIGVFTEIFGAALITLVLLGLYFISGKADFTVIFEAGVTGSGRSPGFSAFALSLLMGAWCLTGFEAAADLAEETHQPKSTVPRAVIVSQLSAAIGGFFMLLAFILSIEERAMVAGSGAPLISVLQAKLGARWMSMVGLVVVASIFACGVASMASATRLIFSLARDSMLPFSSRLRRIHPASRAPRIATTAVWALSCAVVLLIRRLEIITSISAVAGYLGYCGIVTAALMSARKSGNRGAGFSLGRLQRPVQWVALAWTLIVVAALTVPANRVEGFSDTHLPAKSALAALLLGLAVYLVLIRSRILRGQAGPPLEKSAA